MTKTTLAERRAAAGYSHGAKKDRCSTCANCTSTKLKYMAIRSDRHCTELDAPVSASGTCNLYLPGSNNDMTDDADLEGLAA